MLRSVCMRGTGSSHKLYKVCISALYLNMVDADTCHEVCLAVAYIEDMNYFCFLVEVYFTTGCSCTVMIPAEYLNV